MFEKVVLVEDNDQDQKIISRYLTKAGVKILEVCPTGEEGVMAAQRVKPDIVLTDTMLPGIDGFEVCRRVKAALKDEILVVIMTGRVSAVDVGRAKEMGADEYCVKTSDCAELLAAIKGLYDRRTLARPKVSNASILSDGGTVSGAASWEEQKTNQSIKALSQELERKNEELKELDRLKSIFLANVSHELRTPLTIIDGAVSQVISGIYGPVNEEQSKKLAMALRASERLRLLIDDLLDFAKLEAKKAELKRESVNIVEIAREIHASFYTLFQEKQIELVTWCSHPVILAPIDRSRVMQVFTNLVGNSLKFTRAGKVKISIADLPDLVECKVADTGCGVAYEDLPKVFNRFQQFGDGPHPGGTGLGLSICREIVELHGGTIKVDTQPGKGITFSFTFPKTLPVSRKQEQTP